MHKKEHLALRNPNIRNANLFLSLKVNEKQKDKQMDQTPVEIEVTTRDKSERNEKASDGQNGEETIAEVEDDIAEEIKRVTQARLN